MADTNLIDRDEHGPASGATAGYAAVSKEQARRDYKFNLPSQWSDRCACCASCVRSRCTHLGIEIVDPNRSVCPHYYPYTLTFGSGAA